jgi:hypothetical protein
MTPAERQRRRRARLKAAAPPSVTWPHPWDSGIPTRPGVTKFLDQLYAWIEGGEAEQVAAWLAFVICDEDRWRRLNVLVRLRQAEEAAAT